MSIFGNYKPLSKIIPKKPEYSYPDRYSTNQQIEEEIISSKSNNILSFLILIVTLLIFKLFSLQVVEGNYNLNLAEGNRIRVKNIPAPRGVIFDANNEPLVKNITKYDLVILPADLPKGKQERDSIYAKILEHFEIDIGSLKEKIEKEGLFSIDPIILQENLPLEDAFKYQVWFNEVSGISVLKTPIRQYPENIGIGHLLGYVGKISKDELNENNGYKITDLIGKTGLELNYEKYLKGIDGNVQIEIDSQGRFQRDIAYSPAVQGNNLHLYLDLEMQKTAYSELAKSASENGIGKGVAIAINPKNGGIYSYVSLPDYNANAFVKNDRDLINEFFTSKNKPLLNRGISGEYPSGSSIKPVYAAAALQENVITENFAIDTPPEIKIGEFTFPDWKDHGLTNIKKAIAESNNIFFYALGGGWGKIRGLGIDKMDEYLNKFGFGEKTGIDILGERSGFVPTPQWKKEKKGEPWYIGDTYHLAIGQGDISITPIQLVTALSSIVNSGEIIKPHFVDYINSVDNEQMVDYDKQVRKNNSVSGKNLNIVIKGMREAVEYGSAKRLYEVTGENGQNINAAGKTGTAQFGSEGKTHAWFIGFAPWDDPKIALVVLVESGGEGYSSALPIAQEMFRKFFRENNAALK